MRRRRRGGCRSRSSGRFRWCRRAGRRSGSRWRRRVSARRRGGSRARQGCRGRRRGGVVADEVVRVYIRGLRERRGHFGRLLRRRGRGRGRRRGRGRCRGRGEDHHCVGGNDRRLRGLFNNLVVLVVFILVIAAAIPRRCNGGGRDRANKGRGGSGSRPCSGGDARGPSGSRRFGRRRFGWLGGRRSRSRFGRRSFGWRGGRRNRGFGGRSFGWNYERRGGGRRQGFPGKGTLHGGLSGRKRDHRRGRRRRGGRHNAEAAHGRRSADSSAADDYQ